MKTHAILIITALFTACSHATEPLSPPEGWSWDRPVPAHAKQEQDTLMIRTEKGRVWAGTGSQNRLKAIKALGTENEAMIDVELVDAVGTYEQCGLLLHLDDDNFVKLVVEHIKGEHFVVAAFEFDKKRNVMAKIKIDGSRAKLRLRVKGRVVTAYRRVDVDWKMIAELTWTPNAARHFMVFSQDGNPQQARWAKVHELKLK